MNLQKKTKHKHKTERKKNTNQKIAIIKVFSMPDTFNLIYYLLIKFPQKFMSTFSQICYFQNYSKDIFCCKEMKF